jgi:gliding motility-associated protein GldE
LEPDHTLSVFSVVVNTPVNSPDFKTITGLAVMVLFLIGSALMSASELAYFSFRPEDIERFKAKKNRRTKTAIRLYSKPEKLLSTILVGNITINIAIVLLAAYLSPRIFDFSNEPVIGFIVNVVIITFLLLFFGEVMPKVYASRNYTTIALIMAIPLAFLQKLFLPITSLLIFSTSFVKRRTGSRHSNISMDDLSNALELTSDDNNEDDKILKGIVNFGNINVSAIMCPRMEVTAIDIRSGFDKIVPVIISSGFSRIPVYSGSFDTVKGILYAKDVLPYTNNPAGFKWQALLRPPYFVPETKKINELLKEFQTRKIHLAVVIDEYGGTSGIVTLEDILEEIVGEITDESDQDELLYRKIDDKAYIFEGKILLNEFCKVFEFEEEIFDEVRGESETLAGLILELTGEIPQKDQVIKYGEFIFRIESADRRRIKEIRAEIVKNDGEKKQE